MKTSGIGIETFQITGIGNERFQITGIGIAQSELDPTLVKASVANKSAIKYRSTVQWYSSV